MGEGGFRAHRTRDVARPARGPIQPQLREWSAPEFEVDADCSVAAGINGEAAVLNPPVRFRILPRVLCARIASSQPGASPSAVEAEGRLPSLRACSTWRPAARGER